MHIVFPILFLISTMLVDLNTYRPYYIPKKYLLLFIIPCILIFLVLDKLFLNKKKHIKIPYIALFIILLFSWQLITNHSYFREYTNILWHFSLILVTVLVFNISKTKKMTFINLLFISLFSVGALQSIIIGIYQYSLAPDHIYNTIKTPLIGTIGPPNGYGSILALSMVSGIVLFLKSRNLTARVSCTVLILLILIALILNGSRGAILAFIVSILFLVYVLVPKYLKL